MAEQKTEQPPGKVAWDRFENFAKRLLAVPVEELKNRPKETPTKDHPPASGAK